MSLEECCNDKAIAAFVIDALTAHSSAYARENKLVTLALSPWSLLPPFFWGLKTGASHSLALGLI